jgi:7,8-dihydropterin-6-yl-methyl-4-(beta-D-ribofuranosyl)aminobenzene 5'-phosphate synthase
MKITILNDNAPGKGCLSEFGLSFLIEADQKILFDTGTSDVFLQNAARLKISLNDIHSIVLSHGHYDHGNGLSYLSGKPLVCHPGAFSKRFRKKDHSYIGLNLSENEAREKFDLILSRKPYAISHDITFLGEIPRVTEFEAKTTFFIDADGVEDFVPDDSALVIKTPKGLVVVSGCAHAGICNTIAYAREVTGIADVYAVMGGFHLRGLEGDQTFQTISYLKQLGVEKVYPSHCTALPALAMFYQEFKIHQVLTGDFFIFE